MKSEQKQGGTLTTVVRLSDLGVLRVAGTDAVSFLQGQLSNDVSRVTSGQPVFAGYHNPQGRAIALLRFMQTGAGDILAILPSELIPGVVARLRKFILRAKVVLTDESDAWQVYGVVGPTDLSPSIPVDSTRQYVLTTSAISTDAPREAWTALDIEAGIPQVYAATSEAFVAQMLNLDLLDGIAFDKGCYTGQEVIARAHYRGRVKRRMQRFRSSEPLTLGRGDSARLGDGRSIKIVETDGHREFLAVASSEPQAEGTGPTIEAEQLPLPYSSQIDELDLVGGQRPT